jgi:class 3 adenylate cyclase/tetratricopeptide (TPR) repeat protein
VAPEELRKTVTILFADVAGSTALGERLDPESLRQVMSRYFNEMRAVVDRHGGTVEKFIGDAVMAVFGIPRLHEDDALRAVRAAVEMGEALARLNEELERQWDVRIQIRTGLNTGEVVAGDPASGQSLVTGDAVNVAARLEQAADPGEILLGAETYRLARDAVHAEPVAPLDLRGKTDRVDAYRLLEVLPGAPALARRLDSPLVGRSAELEALSGALQDAEAQRACRLVTVVGEAGAGKSRLVNELLGSAGTNATILSGRCLPYGEGITFWPIAEALKAHAGITEQDSAEDARSRIGALLLPGQDADLLRDRVVAAIGIEEGSGELQETFWAIRRLLESLAADRPIVLLIEDIHWAEPTLLDLLQYVVGFSRGSPILLLCTARPELREAQPEWGVAAATVTLSPLTEEQTEELIENLLGRTPLPPEVRTRIGEAAEGNPLFVEEMLRMLIDAGLLVRDDGHWRQEGDLSEVPVPGTIQALLSARLDRLQDEERAVIQRASVVGKIFYWGAVAALTPEAERPAVGPGLQTLLRKELVRPDRSPFAGEDAFRFSHILVRDAAYESLPKRIRVDLHSLFAAWLEDRAGPRIAEFEELLGYHLEQAYRYRSALGPLDAAALAVARQAASRLAASGRRSLQRGDMPAASNLLHRAADLLPSDDPTRPVLLNDLGTALTDLGDLRRASEVLDQAAEGAAAAGDRGLEWHARVQGAWVRGVQGPMRRWDSVLGELREAINVFEELGDETGLARAWTFMAEHFNDLAKRGEMAEAASRAMEHARQAGDRREEAMSARLLGGSLYYGPTPLSEAIPRFEEVVRAAAERPMVEAAVLPVLGGLYGMSGRFDEARASFDRARARNEELGLRFFSARLALLVGDFEMFAGDLAAAERECRRGCEIFKEMGETGRFSTLAAQLADALFRLGRDDEAYEVTVESEQATSAEDVDALASWRRVRAKVLARRGDVEQADALIRESLRLAESSPDDVHLHSKVLKDVGTVLLLSGRPREGIPHVERALELELRKENVPGAEQARALLRQLAAEGG